MPLAWSDLVATAHLLTHTAIKSSIRSTAHLLTHTAIKSSFPARHTSQVLVLKLAAHQALTCFCVCDGWDQRRWPKQRRTGRRKEEEDTAGVRGGGGQGEDGMRTESLWDSMATTTTTTPLPLRYWGGLGSRV
eukprot:513992-Rhodomonas_salina.1